MQKLSAADHTACEQIEIAAGRDPKVVVIGFGKFVAFIEMSPEDARGLAAGLLEKATEAEGEAKPALGPDMGNEKQA